MKPEDTKPDKTHATAPPGKLTLNGRVLLISQPTPADLGAITLDVKRYALTPLARLVNDPAFARLPERLQERAIDKAAQIQATGEQGLSFAEVADLMIKPDCLAFGIWLLARKNHPDLKLEDVRQHVTEANAAELFVLFNEASGMATGGNSPGAPG